MSGNRGIRLVALLAGLAIGAGARASDGVDVPKLKFGITLTAKPTKRHIQDAVQTVPTST